MMAAVRVSVASSTYNHVAPALIAGSAKQLVVALANHEHVTLDWFQFNFVEATDWLVPNNSTEISLSASVLFAWVDTVVILAGLVLSTIIVHLTLALGTFDPSVAK